MKMRRTSGKKGIKIAVGVVGIVSLVVLFFFGKWLSTIIYHKSDLEIKVQTDLSTELQPPKAALTEEELEELFRYIKEVAMNSEQSKDMIGANVMTVETSEGTSEIDFDYLWTINEDIIGWITIPGTNIDYPILQHPSDDSYYLNHNIDGSYGYPGCIYIESLNSKDFSDPNTVLYGHNLKAKTMFTELHKFENRDFFDEHNEVIIYLPEETLYYRIFAAHVYDDRHLMYSFDFSDEDIYSNFLQSIYDIRDMNANINRDFTVTSQDRIITLATCMPSKADKEKRLLVHAVLLEDN